MSTDKQFGEKNHLALAGETVCWTQPCVKIEGAGLWHFWKLLDDISTRGHSLETAATVHGI